MRGMKWQPLRRMIEKNPKGQGMVEFALTLTLLLTLVFGIIEFGRLLFVYSASITAAREAARYGAAAGEPAPGVTYYQDCDGIRAAALRIGNLAGIQAGDINIEYDNGPGVPDTILDGCPMGGTGPSLPETNPPTWYRINITLSAVYRPIVPLVNISSEITIPSSASRTLIKNVRLE